MAVGRMEGGGGDQKRQMDTTFDLRQLSEHCSAAGILPSPWPMRMGGVGTGSDLSPA